MRYLFALCAAANALPPALPPFALEGVITTARDFAAATPLQAPTGLTRSSYLPVIAGIVEHFRHLQDADGAIIDQYRNVETQYATPCFAFACATVVANGGDQTLLPNCTAALSRSIEELATATCADGHCAFFGKPVVFAYRILSALVAPGVAAGWRSGLAQLNPWKDYGFPSGNWGLVAAVGEFMRASVLGVDANTTWFEDMLKFQLGGQGHDQSYSYTPNGLYEDHSGDAGLNPLPYDTFPSSGYLTVLLHEGYNGTFAPIISELMQRAVWSHLLMQSPSGEIPTGGRSSQHNWNEAVSAIAYEAYAATTLAAGDAGAACMFKRAARKSLASVSRWQNPGGELQIVKNHVDAAQRWGYEGSVQRAKTPAEPLPRAPKHPELTPVPIYTLPIRYSFQSNYNLLPAAMLSAAFAYATPATEALGECTTFSDVGGFVFQLPEHHLVIANAGGVYVEVETGADPHYESTGLHRVHVDTCGAQPAPGCVALRGVLGPTASPPIGPSAEAPPQVTGGGVAVGAFWVRGGVTTALANMTFQDVSGVALGACRDQPARPARRRSGQLMPPST